MQSGNSNTEPMGDFVPDQADKGSRSAFPRLSSSPLIQQAIENGEINKSDIDLLEKAQRLSGMGQTLGFFLGSAGAFVAVRRLRPRAGFGTRLAGFFFGGMFGSFVGFISGSVAGAMEVNTKMPDANRKLKKIAEITQKARDMKREEYLQRRGLPPPLSGSPDQPQIPRSFPPQQPQRPYPDSSASPSSPYYPRPTSDSWSSASTYTDSEDTENQREQAGELDRQKNYPAEMKQIERDSQMSPLSSPYDRDPAPSDSGYGRGQSSNLDPPIGRPQAGRPGGSAWDRLRRGETQGAAQSANTYGPGADASGDENARTKEQREFDAMLERERRGEGDTETWK